VENVAVSPFTVRGHCAVVERLFAALDADRLPHALIFSGPSGIGKARAARRLVARVACREKSPPCGECAPCSQVAAATHPDLEWLSVPSGKKEIGVDLARRLKRFVQMRAVSAPRKMAVVDDAERLSIAAQNALLKTLEEPPGEALLVLVTATPGALLPTVRSRCRMILFSPLQGADVRAVLADEGIEATQAESLSRLADGSPGRALHRRQLLQETQRQELLQSLADLDHARYGSILAMSKLLGRNEQEMAARLEEILILYRDDAVRDLAEPAGAPTGDAASAVRAAGLVNGALQMLRTRNPNRPLLAEALLLRLARS
jgi:DNA polymerase III subunit delta'